MSSPVRRDGVARREALLDAALDRFEARGLLSTGIDEIRRAAGASASSVYHQFGGLEDLVLALLERTFERLFRHLASRVTATRTAEAAVSTLVEAHLEWTLSQRREARFMYQAMALDLGEVAAARLGAHKATLLAPIAEHFGRFVAAGELPNWSPLAFDVVLLGPAHEAVRRVLGGADLDPAWLRRELPRVAVRSSGAHCTLLPRDPPSARRRGDEPSTGCQPTEKPRATARSRARRKTSKPSSRTAK